MGHAHAEPQEDHKKDICQRDTVEVKITVMVKKAAQNLMEGINRKARQFAFAKTEALFSIGKLTTNFSHRFLKNILSRTIHKVICFASPWLLKKIFSIFEHTVR